MINQTANGQVYLAALLIIMASIVYADMVVLNTGIKATDTATTSLAVVIDNNIEESPVQTTTRVWASSDQQLVLFGINKGNFYRVCPRFLGKTRQPFCRQFSSELINACGNHDRVVLVMANGDIHEVNDALMGLDGDFEPLIHPESPVHVRSAFFAGQGCGSHDRLPEVMAIRPNGEWVHFDGLDWQPIIK